LVVKLRACIIATGKGNKTQRTMYAPKDYVTIRADKMHEDSIKHGSLNLALDSGYAPTVHARTFGEVVGVPRGLSNADPYPGMDIEINVGEKVYFHYNALDDNFKHHIEGDLYYVPYWMIFCAIRESKILPVAGWALAKPWWEMDVCDIEMEGKTVKAVVGSSGLITEIDPPYSKKIARLSHIGSPLKSQGKLDLNEGELFYYDKYSDFENEIEGQKYFVMQQDCILGKPIEQ
jgi:co-chaperonin GroES (HSP10)